MPAWAWTALVLGGTLIAALVCWLIYFKFFLAPDEGAGGNTAPAAAPASDSDAQVPGSAEPRGSFADAAAHAAIVAASKAQAAAHSFLDSFSQRSPPAAAPSPPSSDAAAASSPADPGAPDGDTSEQAPAA